MTCNGLFHLHLYRFIGIYLDILFQDCFKMEDDVHLAPPTLGTIIARELEVKTISIHPVKNAELPGWGEDGRQLPAKDKVVMSSQCREHLVMVTERTKLQRV